MSSNTIDALVYSGIKNNLTSVQMVEAGISSKFPDQPTMGQADYTNQVLSSTTIKRACAQNYKKPNVPQDKFVVSVRIPTPEGFNVDQSSNAAIYKKFGFIDKTVYVPASLCTTLEADYSYQSSASDDFMSLYCNNMKLFYNDEIKLLGTSYNDNEFSQYKPECACYIDKPGNIGASGANAPPLCYAPGCDQSTTAYLDPKSRGTCTMNICSSVVNVGTNSTVGGNVSANTNVKLACPGQTTNADPVPSADALAAAAATDAAAASQTTTPSSDSTTTEPSSDSTTTEPSSDSTMVTESTTTVTAETSASSMYILIAVVLILILCCCSVAGYFMFGKKKK